MLPQFVISINLYTLCLRSLTRLSLHVGLIADHTLMCADDCYRMTYPGACPYLNPNFVGAPLAAYPAEMDSCGTLSHLFASQVAFFEMLVGDWQTDSLPYQHFEECHLGCSPSANLIPYPDMRGTSSSAHRTARKRVALSDDLIFVTESRSGIFDMKPYKLIWQQWVDNSGVQVIQVPQQPRKTNHFVAGLTDSSDQREDLAYRRKVFERGPCTVQ